MDISKLIGEKITAIQIVQADFISQTEKKLVADKITIYCGEKGITITPLCNTDEISVTVSSHKYRGITSEKNILSQFIGTKLGYTWNGMNTNGYSDMFIVAFDDLQPDVLFLSEGSSVKLFLINQC